MMTDVEAQEFAQKQAEIEAKKQMVEGIVQALGFANQLFYVDVNGKKLCVKTDFKRNDQDPTAEDFTFRDLGRIYEEGRWSDTAKAFQKFAIAAISSADKDKYEQLLEVLELVKDPNIDIVVKSLAAVLTAQQFSKLNEDLITRHYKSVVKNGVTTTFMRGEIFSAIMYREELRLNWLRNANVSYFISNSLGTVFHEIRKIIDEDKKNNHSKSGYVASDSAKETLIKLWSVYLESFKSSENIVFSSVSGKNRELVAIKGLPTFMQRNIHFIFNLFKFDSENTLTDLQIYGFVGGYFSLRIIGAIVNDYSGLTSEERTIISQLIQHPFQLWSNNLGKEQKAQDSNSSTISNEKPKTLSERALAQFKEKFKGKALEENVLAVITESALTKPEEFSLSKMPLCESKFALDKIFTDAQLEDWFTAIKQKLEKQKAEKERKEIKGATNRDFLFTLLENYPAKKKGSSITEQQNDAKSRQQIEQIIKSMLDTLEAAKRAMFHGKYFELSIDQPNSAGETMLGFAIRKGCSYELLKKLVEYLNADVRVRSNSESLIQIAVDVDNGDAIYSLREKNIAIDDSDPKVQPYVFRCIEKRSYEALKALLDTKDSRISVNGRPPANVKIMYQDETLLSKVIRDNLPIDYWKLLLQSGADVNAKSKGDTVLQLLIKQFIESPLNRFNNTEAFLQELLKVPNLNLVVISEEKNNTVLHDLASAYEDKARANKANEKEVIVMITQLLISNSSNRDVANKDGAIAKDISPKLFELAKNNVNSNGASVDNGEKDKDKDKKKNRLSAFFGKRTTSSSAVVIGSKGKLTESTSKDKEKDTSTEEQIKHRLPTTTSTHNPPKPTPLSDQTAISSMPQAKNTSAEQPTDATTSSSKKIEKVSSLVEVSLDGDATNPDLTANKLLGGNNMFGRNSASDEESGDEKEMDPNSNGSQSTGEYWSEPGYWNPNGPTN